MRGVIVLKETRICQDSSVFCVFSAPQCLRGEKSSGVRLMDRGRSIVDEIDIERARAAMKRAEERLKQAAEIDFARASSALERAVSRIMVSERR